MELEQYNKKDIIIQFFNLTLSQEWKSRNKVTMKHKEDYGKKTVEVTDLINLNHIYLNH